MSERVAVLGGGVAGLTAAHELAERGFEVTVYEARDRLGGKARSLPVPGSGAGGRADLPAEHGFRFFPGFYKHVPDTMRRIGVDQHLVGAERVLLAQGEGRNELITPAHLPESLEDFALVARFLFEAATKLGVPPQDTAWFVDRLVILLTSCDERRLGQWELESWWRFVDADRRSPAFQKFLADGLTRTLVAAKAHEMSARTGGAILLQLIFDLTRAGGRADRVLDGPTSDVWIDPWAAHLEGLGVEFRRGAPVQGIQLAGGRVAGATVGGETVTADRYVAAVPVEVMRLLASPELRAAEPRLTRLDKLVTRWMNGVMFYLREDVPVVNGHALYVDSEWALTSISQRQFWRGFDFGQVGDGSVGGILSIDVSDWTMPSRRLGKIAMQCSRDEVLDEVWAQLQDHLEDLDRGNVVLAFLDPAIEFPNPTQAANLEPLLVNTSGSWADRPDAVTRIPNLYLASDYVRTHTDLATMEGANEAARRAVNGILDASGSSAPRCEIWPLREPAMFGPAKALDRVRWRLFRRPPRSPLRVTEDGDVEPTGPVAAGLVRLSPLLRRLRG
jgi:uncharacterized protein with NAD-binding domain and iron-sulfur cluster